MNQKVIAPEHIKMVTIRVVVDSHKHDTININGDEYMLGQSLDGTIYPLHIVIDSINNKPLEG